MSAYPPEQFTSQSLGAAIEIASICKLATLIHTVDGAMTTIHIPMTVRGDPPNVTFVGHIARNNPLYETLLAGAATVRLIFLPADGYVSPKLYAEKEKSGKVVPTWNYVAAHIDGELSAVESKDALLETLSHQSDDYEAVSGGDWQVTDAPSDYIDAMAKLIVAIELIPTTGIAIEKLSQNKPKDIEAITDWFRENEPPSRSVAYWMKRQAEK